MTKSKPSKTQAQKRQEKVERQTEQAAKRKQEAEERAAEAKASAAANNSSSSVPRQSKREQRAIRKAKKKELQAASKALLSPAQPEQATSSRSTHAILAGPAHAAQLMVAKDIAKLTQNHSTHIERLIPVLRKLCIRYGPNGIERVTPGKLATRSSHAETFTVQVQRGVTARAEDERVTTYKAVARLGTQAQDVFIVVNPDLIKNNTELQKHIESVVHGDDRPLHGPHKLTLMFETGPLNVRPGSEEARLYQKNVRAEEGISYAAHQRKAAERKRDEGVAKKLRQLKARVPAADRASLQTRAKQNHDLDTGRCRRGKQSFGGRVNQIK